MPEQTCVPFGAERFQPESLIVPIKKESARVLTLVSKRSNDTLPKSGEATRNGTAEYFWLSSGRDALPKSGKATDSSVTDLLNPSAGYNLESEIAELEKQWAELFALARAAEARAQEAEEKRESAENYARSLKLALAEADQKRAKAEATARAAEENADKIKALFLGAEAVAHEATESHLVFGFLIFENRRAEQRLKDFDRRFPWGDTLQHSWVEFGEFARKIAKSVDKMLINLFSYTGLLRIRLDRLRRDLGRSFANYQTRQTPHNKRHTRPNQHIPLPRNARE